VFKKRLPRNILGPKSEKVTGDWRKLRSDELCDLYFSFFIQMLKYRNMYWKTSSTKRERRNVYRGLVRRPGGKKLHGISWRRWKDNIKGYIK
jgi:hypothetical protein